ncbi:hypothetical protein H4S07_002541, partial [Coemansia furcata]
MDNSGHPPPPPNYQQQQQQSPGAERNFSPTNPFSGMNDQQFQGPTYSSPPPPAMQQVPPGSSDDMTGAAARLANLQLGTPGSSNHGTPVHVTGAATSRSYPAAPPPVSTVAGGNYAAAGGVSAANYAPGYGPPPPVVYGTDTMQQQQQQAPQRGSFDGVGAEQGQAMQAQQAGQMMGMPAMVGPMVQFVDVELERALWHGSVLILTNEAYLVHGRRASGGPALSAFPATGASMHAGPTPVADSAQQAPVVEVWDDAQHGPGAGKPKTFVTRAIYTEPTFQYTFWRADITLPLPQENEADVLYQVYWGADEAAIRSHSARTTFSFRIPAQASQWRMCVTSNAQFARRVPDPARSALRGSGPVFRDLLAKHRANPFHVWIGTGGQFSGDAVWDDCEPALRPFLAAEPARRPLVPWTADMAGSVERWYFLEYLRQWFGVGGGLPLEQEGQRLFAQAAACMPYSFTADVEIFPLYGSYAPALHFSPVFGGVRHVGAKYYALFQAHTTPTLAHNEHGFV